MHDTASFRLPGAETFREVQERVLEALYEIAEANPGRTVVITTHGVAIRCMLTKLLGVPLDDRETVPIFHNTGISHLYYENGRFTVDTVDDASHLPPELMQSSASVTVLRHVYVDPGQYRALYERCYADAWTAAHGNLNGFEPEPYYRAARDEHAGYGWVSLLYLCPEYRRRGLGVQLLGGAVTKYRTLGRRAVRLYAAEDNTAALAFYRANGFAELSRAPGTNGELLLMEKQIGGRGHGT